VAGGGLGGGSDLGSADFYGGILQSCKFSCAFSPIDVSKKRSWSIENKHIFTKQKNLACIAR